jgi:hypothetical protein
VTTCAAADCVKPIDRDGLCFLHRVKGVGFSFRGGAIIGRNGWNTTRREFLQEHVGGTERELANNPSVEKVG